MPWRMGPDRRVFLAAGYVLAFASMARGAKAQTAKHDHEATQKSGDALPSDKVTAALAKRFGGPFSLVDHTGKRVSEKDYLGRYLLVYFGFTACTDTCPVDLPLLMGALDRLGSRAGMIQPLFISVDPRDTPEVMKGYVEAHHPRLIGLTGNEAELAAVAKVYRVHRRKLLLPEKGGGQGAHAGHGHAVGSYTIDHGSLGYLMGPDGGFLTLFTHQTPMERIAQVLATYLPDS